MDFKKISLVALVAVIFGGYIIYENFFNKPATPTPIIDNKQTTQAPPPPQTQNNPPPPQTTQSGYKDGQYTGDVANTIYGDVQVKAIVTGGKIADIQMLQVPNKPGHTTDLANSSFPILKSEAIQTQKANVDVVSGATQNSEGFTQSLASALAKAV